MRLIYRLIPLLFVGAIHALYLDKEVQDVLYKEGHGCDAIISFSKAKPLYESAYSDKLDLDWIPLKGYLIEYLYHVKEAFYLAHSLILKKLEYLASTKYPGFDYHVIWAYDCIWVTGLDKTTLKYFAELEPSCSIMKDRVYESICGVVNKQSHSSSSSSGEEHQPQWGVSILNAPKAWKKGYTGKGVVVGVIDTGIRATHRILKDKLCPKYHWYDAVNKRPEPYDDNGHGTHCAGTVAGADGYGVAPGACLIGCKALNAKGQATTSSILTCGQFMLCPTDPWGKNEDCSQAPDIVTNSWGGAADDQTWFDKIVDTWILNGQIAIFASGNTGPGCGTVVSPADYTRAIAVGAVDSNCQLTNFSSRGPASGHGPNLLGSSSLCMLESDAPVKPDVVGPGRSIMSAGIQHDDHYATMSGTSMAAPHVTGMVAVMLSHNPTLTQVEVQKILQDSAVPTGAIRQARYLETECGCTTLSTTPNNLEGYGFVQFPSYLMASEIREKYSRSNFKMQHRPRHNRGRNILPLSFLER